MIQAQVSDGAAAPQAASVAPGRLTLVAMLGFGFVAVLGVLVRPLLPIDETRYLAVAWEMRLTGDWIVPHLNGAIYGHKPPLLFWLINLVWSVTGVSEVAARLIGPAFGMATIAVTALLAQRLRPGDQAAGGPAALALAGLATFSVFAGLTMFDAMLALATASGALALTYARSSRFGWIGFGAAVALGVLAKGPVILLHLLPLAILSPVWAGIAWRRMAAGLGLGLLVAIALVSFWLIPALVLGGADYRTEILWTQSAGRMVESFAHLRPWWFYLPLLPLLLWPWAWSPDVWRGLRTVELKSLAPIWAGSALVMFSLLSGKQTHYLLPALPAVALIVGDILSTRVVRAPAAALVPAIAGAAILAAAAGLVDGDAATFADPAWLAAIVGLLCLGLAAAAFRLDGVRLALLGIGAVAIANLAFLAEPGRVYDAGRIGALLAPHDDAGVAVVGAYSGEFTFAARLRRPVRVFEDGGAAMDWHAAAPDRALVARLGKRAPAEKPRDVVAFRGRDYGVWTSPVVLDLRP